MPIIVAINKCDLQEKNIRKIKNEMMQYELIAEDLSGDTLFVKVSALQKLNLDKRKESILLQSEILDLKASYSDKARGVVIESKIDKGKGPVSTILINNGKLKRGDYFICGDTWGKIRAMINYEGKMVNEALPSMTVAYLGMNSSAYAGAEIMVTKEESEAQELTEFKQNDTKKNKNLAKYKTTFQMVSLSILIISLGFELNDFLWNLGLVTLWLAAIITLLSGYNYVAKGLKHI